MFIHLSKLAPAFVLAAAAASWSTVAMGSEDDAKTLFAQGRVARTAGDCGQAIGLFQRALELHPTGIGALRNIAECQEQLGRFEEARRSYWDLRVAAMKSGDVRYDGWAEFAEKAHERLAAEVAQLIVRIEGLEGRKATVVLDGKPLDPRLWETKLERDPGVHELSVDYGAAAPLRRSVTLSKGEEQTVVLKVAPSTKEAPPLVPVTPTDPAPAAYDPTLRGLAITSFGFAGGGLVGTIVSLVVRQGALSDLEGNCADYETMPCSAEVQGAVDRGETASLLVNVMIGVTAVGAAAGLGFWIASDSGDDPTATGSVAVGVEPAVGGLGPTVKWRF